jgi:nicotinate-nucleotide pyrophosphorylase (carboxylating)
MSSDKQSLILNHFQKIDLLTISNKTYQKCVNDLCEWLLRNDKVQDDLTSKLLFTKQPHEIAARIVSKQSLTIAGIAEVGYLLDTFTEIKFTKSQFDGMAINSKDTIIEMRGTAAEILAYERTILNILQRLSGIATATNEIVENIKTLNLSNPPLVTATRKTPWTLLDKKAVSIGGGGTHRINLADGVLVKDNHLLILKEIYKLTNEPELVVKTFQILNANKKEMLIEIEVEQPESIEALIKAALSGDRTNTLCIMLDNFTPKEAKKTMDNMREKYDLSKIIFEASGGITKDNIVDWAQIGVDVISLGALTHSAKAVDISLDIT